MNEFVIKGGKPLVGEVSISGAKNAALGILAAAVMCNEPVKIENLPYVSDIQVLLSAIEEIGTIVERIDNHTVRINGGTITNFCVDNEFIRKIRASYYLLGALLGKNKDAKVAFPGGCNIGSRPIDQHIKGFEALGAEIDIRHSLIAVKADELVGSHIYFDVSSVGINTMLAATLAKGKTIMENVAKEPHVVDVANFLNSMGADIKGAGTDVIRIVGVEKLHGSEYSIIPDMIEAGTYMVAAAATAAATKGDVLVKNLIPKHMEAISAKLIETGAEVYEFDDAIRVCAKNRLNHTHVKTLPYPGFPTDMQPQITTLLAMSNGTSVVTESIFENRFKFTDELAKMGANIKVEGNSAIIDGVEKLSGAKLSSPDLRAGAALVIAGLCSEEVSEVDQIEFIERGYEHFEEKLKELGADIAKIPVDDEKELMKFKLRVG